MQSLDWLFRTMPKLCKKALRCNLCTKLWCMLAEVGRYFCKIYTPEEKFPAYTVAWARNEELLFLVDSACSKVLVVQ